MIKVGLIGIGGMGGVHYNAYKTISGAEVVAVADVRVDMAREKTAGDGVNVYATLDELLANEKVDMIDICTPSYLHTAMAERALLAGCHVLCEKPLAQKVEDCYAMIEAAKRNNVKFMTGQVARKSPGFVKAKELVASGAIGDLFFVESEYAHDYQFLEPLWRKDPVNLRYSIIGGGCHAIDLLRWIAGDPEKVMALANRKVLTDWPVDDCTIAIMQFPNGVVGKIYCGIGVKRNYTMRTCLYGTKGTIICDNTSPEITLFRHAVTDNGQHIYPDVKIPVNIANHNIAAEIKDMAESILNDTPLECTVYEGANTVAVGIAAVESAAKGGEPVAPRYYKK